MQNNAGSNTPKLEFHCQCEESHPIRIQTDWVMGPVSIRMQDLEPRLGRLGKILRFPLLLTSMDFGRTASNTECASNTRITDQIAIEFEAQGFLFTKEGHGYPLNGSPEGADSDLGTTITSLLNGIRQGKQHGDYFRLGPAAGFPADSMMVYGDVGFAGEPVARLWLGPFQWEAMADSARPESARRALFHLGTGDDGIPGTRMDQLRIVLQSQAEELEEVLWRRAGDHLVEHCTHLTEHVRTNHPTTSGTHEGDALQVVRLWREEAFQGIAGLLRQITLVEGVIVYLHDPSADGYGHLAHAGPDPRRGWKYHSLEEASLTREAHRNGLAFWDSDCPAISTGEVHQESLLEFNHYHPGHPIKRVVAVRFSASDPTLFTLFNLFNPLGQCNGELAGSSFVDLFRHLGQEEEGPPVGRNRFLWLASHEFTRLLSNVMRTFREELGRAFFAQPRLRRKPIQEISGQFLAAFREMTSATGGIHAWRELKQRVAEGALPWDRTSTGQPELADLFTGEMFLLGGLKYQIRREARGGTSLLLHWPSLAEESREWTFLYWDQGMELEHVHPILRSTSEWLHRCLTLRDETLEKKHQDVSRRALDEFHNTLQDFPTNLTWEEMQDKVGRLGKILEKLAKGPCVYFFIEKWADHLPRPSENSPYRLRRIYGDPTRAAEYLPGGGRGTEALDAIETNGKSFWLKKHPSPEHRGPSVRLVHFFGRPRALVVLDHPSGVPSEEFALLEQLAELIARTQYLARLKTGIECGRAIREHPPMLAREPMGLATLPQDLLLRILGSLCKGPDDEGSPSRSWQGFQKALVLLRVPWQRDLLCVGRHPVGSRALPASVSLAALQTLAVPGGTPDSFLKGFHCLDLGASLGPGPGCDQLQDLLDQGQRPYPGRHLFLLPLMVGTEAYAWIVGETVDELPRQKLVLAEVLARDLGNSLDSALIEEELTLSTGMLLHGLRRRMHWAEQAFTNLDARLRMLESREVREACDGAMKSLEAVFENLSSRLDDPALLMRLVRARNAEERRRLLGVAPDQKERTDLGECIQRICLQAKRWADIFRGVEIETGPLPVGKAWVPGREAYFRYLIENLLDNAVKYSFRNRKVRISLHREGSRWHLVITNEGKPFPEEVTQIQMPFARIDDLDPERGTIPGTGLGLTVVRMISDALGATVEFESQPRVPGENSTEALKKLGPKEWCINWATLAIPIERS